MHWIPRLALAGYFYLLVERVVRAIAEMTVHGTSYRSLPMGAEIPIVFIAVLASLAIKSWYQKRPDMVGRLRSAGYFSFARQVLLPALIVFLWIVGLVVLFASPVNLLLMFLKSSGIINAACTNVGTDHFGQLPCRFNAKMFKVLLVGLVLIVPWASMLKRVSQDKAS